MFWPFLCTINTGFLYFLFPFPPYWYKTVFKYSTEMSLCSSRVMTGNTASSVSETIGCLPKRQKTWQNFKKQRSMKTKFALWSWEEFTDYYVDCLMSCQRFFLWKKPLKYHRSLEDNSNACQRALFFCKKADSMDLLNHKVHQTL